ncbi:MAG: zf-TFIIB domain-containing protein [Solirubrobacterales bacterium]
MTDLICPKCQGPMRKHRRNGVTIEQCRRCHGIFLDRGELEQLLGAESSFLGSGPDTVAGRRKQG